MTIKDSLFGSISSSIEDVVTYINGLLTVRQSGWGGQLWTDFWRIFLSRREEKSDYAFSAKATAVSDNMFGDYDSDNIDDPITILDFEKAVLSIHKARGTEKGITADIKRICNSENVTINYNGQDKCGWIGDVTSPELTTDLLYDPDNSLCYMDLDNMVIVEALNNGNRINSEVEKIIRHDFVPLKYNLKTTIINNIISPPDMEFGDALFGSALFGASHLSGEATGIISPPDMEFGDALFGSALFGASHLSGEATGI